MRANLPLSTKSIFLIAAIMLIPTTVVLAVTNDIDCAGTDGFCEGTDANDSMLGTSDTELIKGKNGFDLIFGLGNEGGVSPEELMGGDGGDEIVGDDDVLGLCGGDASCVGVGGNDNIEGENGDDFLVGDIGDDRIVGGNENDILFGGLNADQLFGGNGDDQLFGGSGDDIMFGENGNDFLFGGEGNDDISGGDGIDFIDCGTDAVPPLEGENDIARINPSEDTVVNCELILEDITGPLISTSLEPSGDAASALSDISDDIQALKDAPLNVGTSIEDKLNDAQSKIDDAIGKIGSDNQDALSLIEGAEGDVEAAENEGLDPDDGKIVMDDLAGVGSQIAQDEIAQGIAVACDGSIIDDATESLVEGESLRTSESFKDAVSKYKDAVSKAESCF